MLLPCFFMLLAMQATEGVYENCSTDRSVLLNALFKTEGNLYELDRIFLPARHQTSRYIRVNYTFLDSYNINEGDCSVLYIWANGGFLLVQDPEVFQYTSLLFSRPANELVELHLKLPHECRALVDHGSDGDCTCKTKTDTTVEALDRLTQQLNQYSKFNDPNQVTQDITSSAQAVCEEELDDKFRKAPEIITYLGLTLVMPIIVVIILVTVIRSIHPLLHSKLTKSSADHPNLAGFTLAGIYVLIYVLVLDCIAVHYFRKDTFSFLILPVTLGIDVLITMVFSAFMLYLICTQVTCFPQQWIEFCVTFICAPLCIVPYFFCIFGSKSQASIWYTGQKVTLILQENKLQEARLQQRQKLTLKTGGEVTLKSAHRAKEKSGSNISLKAGDKVTLKENQQVTVQAGQIVKFSEYQFMLNYGQKATVNMNSENVVVKLKANKKAKNVSTGKEITLVDNQEVTLSNIEKVVPKANQQVMLNPEQEITLKAGQKVKLKKKQKAITIVEGFSKDVTLNAGDVELKADMKARISCQKVTLTTDMKNNIEGGKITVNASEDDTINQRNIWVVTGLLIAPLFSIASHSGYILAAWITEPEKTTAAFLVALGSILYMFFMFRQCYTVYKANSTGLCLACCCEKNEDPIAACCCKESSYDYEDMDDGERYCCTYKAGWIYCCCTIVLPFIPCFVIVSHLTYLICTCCQLYSKCCQCYTISFPRCRIPDNDYFNIDEPDNEDTGFSIRRFLLSCSWGWLIVGALVFVVAAFLYLPLPTFPLAEYLETTIQIFIVVLAFMITYRVFTADDTQIQKFVGLLSGLKSKDPDSVVSKA